MTNYDYKRILHESPLGAHEKVLELLKNEKGGKLLDAGAGQGFLSQEFKNNGFDVFAADFDTEKFKIHSIECKKVDLNKDLPYPNSFFDYIVCLEVIEHLENPYHLIREFNRIVKRGGKIIISTPNILNIHARLRYLLRGSADWLHAQIPGIDPKNIFEALRRHINLIGFIELKFILENNGFDIEIVSTNRSVLSYRKGKWFLRPFVACLLYMCAIMVRIMATLIRRKDPLRHQLLSNTLLFGEGLIIKAVKA